MAGFRGLQAILGGRDAHGAGSGTGKRRTRRNYRPEGVDGVEALERRDVPAIFISVSSVSSSLADGTYGAGTTVPITVTFTGAVNVTGTPTLTLNTAPSASASFAFGSGTNTLTFQYVVATTARVGRARPAFQTPREAARKLVEISRKNRVALLFGAEDAGLTNDELRYGHLLVHIPVSERFRSINLSHAVMILCYEIFTAASATKTFAPRLASSGELEGMYEHIKEVSLQIGFINPQNPEYWMTSIRRFLSRVELRSREVKIIRGFCRQLDWFGRKQNP